MTPEIINAQNQVKELEVLAAQDSKRYGVDLNIWKQKLAQYQEHAVANSPEASALLKSNPTAYLQKYGSAQDIKNQASGVNPPAVAPSVLDPTTLRGNEQGLAPTATPLGGATGFPTIPPQIPNLMANKDGIAPLQTGGASGYSSLPSSFSERMNLAGQAGITNYTGTPQQNAQIQAFQAKQPTTPPSAQIRPTGQNLAIKDTLQQGSSDVQVGNLQKTLNELSQAGLVVDNNFGPKTKQAVMAFQQANGLVADGIVGPKTLAKIQELQGQKTQQQNTQKSAVDNNLQNAGVDTGKLENDFASNPTGTIQEIVNQVSQTAGLSQLNTQIQNLTQQQKELADKKVQELNEITNNPWISESLKQRKIGNLDSKYQGLEQNIQSALQIATNQLGNAEEQVRYVTTQAINQYNTQQTLDETRSQNAIENSLALAKLQQDKTAGGLTPAQINTTVNSIAGAFDNEQTVKDYNVIKRQVQVFNSLGESATDDIQRVYAFAKIADPTSAVKEGEYQSIEKYSQALIQRVGLKVNRVFLATGILTPEARTAMSTTIQKSLDSAKTSYDQVYNEYQRQIQDAYSGKPRQITQYTTPEVKYVPGEVVKNSEEPKTFLDNLLSIFGAK